MTVTFIVVSMFILTKECSKKKGTYLVSKEDAVVLITMRRVHPRVADEVDCSMIRNMF